MESPRRTITEVFRPWWVRWLGGTVGAIGVYDTVGGQFELPTLRKIVGMSGGLLPWWGWLLVLQAILVAALFEYVRRNLPIRTHEDFAPGAPTAPLPEHALRALERRLRTAQDKVASLLVRADKIEATEQIVAEHTARLTEIGSTLADIQYKMTQIPITIFSQQEKQRKADLLARLERIQEQRPTLPHSPLALFENKHLFGELRAQHRDYLESMIALIGEASVIRGMERSAMNSIELNPTHYMLKEGEAEKYGDETAKRQWCELESVFGLTSMAIEPKIDALRNEIKP